MKCLLKQWEFKKVKKVTVWNKGIVDKKGTVFFVHNHIEDDWKKENQPVAKSKIQKSSWVKASWQKVFAYLNNDNKVIVKAGV